MAINNSNATYSNKRIAKNTLYLYIRMLLTLVVSHYISRIVLNALGASDYGINNIVDGTISMFAFLSPNYTDEIVSTKVVKFIQSYTEVVNKMVWRKDV